MLRGDRVKNLRLSKNYTQQYFAELLGLNIRQITRYETGEVDPSADVVGRMADVFNVSTDYLLGRTDDPTPCLQASELSPQEVRILAALRRGEIVEAIRVIVSDSAAGG